MTEHEKRIREALEAGPTEGPFEVVRYGTYSYDIKTTDGYIVATTHGYVGDQVTSRPMANFFAACNPAAIRALLADLDAVREALFEAFQEGYWARSTYNDAETSDFQEEWNRSTAKDRALKGATA